jgi:solute carrier family 35, member F5
MFISDYAFNRALQHTTVASCTVLVSTSCVFVLFLSCLLNVEQFSYGRLLGVLCAVAGTAMTTLQDVQDNDAPEHSEKDLLYGDMFSLMAAFGYAAYSVQARVLCPEDEDLFSMPLLLGYVGLISSVPLLPMAIYKLASLENITWKLIWVLCVKGLLDFVVSDYLLFRAVMLTNATVANVGLGLTIPMAFAADFIIKNRSFSVMQILGALSVLMGFVVVNWMSSGATELDNDQQEAIPDEVCGKTESEMAKMSHTLSNISDTSIPYEYPTV